MKIKNASSNSVLKNNIVKHIVLEAPTADELEKKLKKYEIILVRALTSLYQISDLTLSRNNFYHMTPNGSYQAAVEFHFFGFPRQHIPSPQQIVKDLEQLTMLESGKKESPRVITAHLSPSKDAAEKEIKFETASLDSLEDAICSKQKQEIEALIGKTSLEHISFLPVKKEKNPETGKITVSMKCRYQSRALNKSLTGNSAHDGPGEK